MKRILLSLITCLFLIPTFVKAQNTNLADSTSTAKDSVVVSLITCTPGNMVHEFYGHTAIRVREVNKERPSDWVFNYGTFTFNQPHFIWHFVMGEVNFELSIEPYSYFYNRYLYETRGVEEQVLNLTPDEERELVNALSENLRPENASYRYNIFYDNCANRAIRIIESHIQGKVQWDDKQEKPESIRDIVHRFSEHSPWYKFGQDLLLGAEADRPATSEVRQFSPIVAMHMAQNAQIVNHDGTKRPLIGMTLTLLPDMLKVENPYPVTPMMLFGMLLAFTLVLSIYEVKKGKYYWGYDALLMLAQGLTGCIITFLFLFSPHPTVDSNYLIVLFNPFPLLYFPWLMKNASVGKRAKGMYIQAFMLVFALMLAIFGPQEFPKEIYLIIAILALRFFVHIQRTQLK